MPLERQVVHLNFAQGVDQKTDPKQIQVGKLAVLENAYFNKIGRLDKKLGGQNVGPFGVSSPVNVTSYKANRLLIQTSSTSGLGAIYHFTNTTNRAFNCSTATVEGVPLGGTFTNGTLIQGMASDGTTVMVVGAFYAISSGSYGYSVFDIATGALIATGTAVTNVSSAQTMQVVYVPAIQRYCVIGMDFKPVNSGTIFGQLFTTAGATDGAVFQIDTGVQDARTCQFRACVVNNNTVMVLYGVGAATPNLKLAKVTFGPTAVTTASVGAETVYPSANPEPTLTIFARNTTDVYMAWFAGAGTSVRGAIYNTSMAAVKAAFQLGTTTSAGCFGIAGYTDTNSTNRAFVLWSGKNTSSIATLQTDINSTFAQFDQTGLLVGPSPGVGGVCVTDALPSNYGTFVFKYFSTQSGAANTVFVGNYATATNNIARLEPTLASRTQPMGNYTAGDGSVYLIVNKQTRDPSLGGNAVYTAYELVRIRPNQLTYSIEAADCVLYSSGILSDGGGVYETGWPIYPDILTATAAGAGGSLSAGSYQYTYLYEMIDANGNIHRSAPCPNPVTVTTVANDLVTVKLQPLAYSTKYENSPYSTSLALYRTKVNGTIFYRRDTIAAFVGNGLATISYVDGLDDATLTTHKDILYTTSGEVENIAPPMAKFVGKYRNRVILIPAENPYSWWYSKEVIQGYPPEFNDAFVEYVDKAGGPLVACAQLDDKLILFKYGSGIIAITGTGPAPNGTANDFSPPVIVSTDSGCVDGHSVVRYPNGIIFKSDKGWCLLDRSLNVSYIGAPVEGYNSYAVNSAVLMEGIRQVRFNLTSGPTLVYDYYFDQWSVFTTVPNSIATVMSDLITHSAMRYVIVNLANGVAWQEDGSSNFDFGNASILTKITTAWLAFAGMAGFERIRRMIIVGDYDPNYRLQVKLAYNLDPAIVDTITIVPGASPISPWQERVHFPRQKIESMQITLQEVANGAAGTGFTLSGLALEVGVKKGVFKLPAAQSTG